MQNEKIWNSTPETEDDHAKTLTPLSLQSTLASRVKILTEDNKKKNWFFFRWSTWNKPWNDDLLS